MSYSDTFEINEELLWFNNNVVLNKLPESSFVNKLLLVQVQTLRRGVQVNTASLAKRLLNSGCVSNKVYIDDEHQVSANYTRHCRACVVTSLITCTTELMFRNVETLLKMYNFLQTFTHWSAQVYNISGNKVLPAIVADFPRASTNGANTKMYLMNCREASTDTPPREFSSVDLQEVLNKIEFKNMFHKTMFLGRDAQNFELTRTTECPTDIKVFSVYFLVKDATERATIRYFVKRLQEISQNSTQRFFLFSDKKALLEIK